MIPERIYRILLGPHVSEKATRVADQYSHYVFKVAKNATKLEVKQAVEQLFKVKVHCVRTVLSKGKVKQTRYGIGRRLDWKKAYVSLVQGHEIDFVDMELRN